MLCLRCNVAPKSTRTFVSQTLRKICAPRCALATMATGNVLSSGAAVGWHPSLVPDVFPCAGLCGRNETAFLFALVASPRYSGGHVFLISHRVVTTFHEILIVSDPALSFWARVPYNHATFDSQVSVQEGEEDRRPSDRGVGQLQGQWIQDSQLRGPLVVDGRFLAQGRPMTTPPPPPTECGDCAR